MPNYTTQYIAISPDKNLSEVVSEGETGYAYLGGCLGNGFELYFGDADTYQENIVDYLKTVSPNDFFEIVIPTRGVAYKLTRYGVEGYVKFASFMAPNKYVNMGSTECVVLPTAVTKELDRAVRRLVQIPVNSIYETVLGIPSTLSWIGFRRKEDSPWVRGAAITDSEGNILVNLEGIFKSAKGGEEFLSLLIKLSVSPTGVVEARAQYEYNGKSGQLPLYSC